MEVKDCKCGYWMNTAYDVCPCINIPCGNADVSEAKFRKTDEFYLKHIVLIDPKENCILVDQITKV